MKILPAIDIKDGQAVRLLKGDFSQKTVVNPDVYLERQNFFCFFLSLAFACPTLNICLGDIVEDLSTSFIGDVFLMLGKVDYSSQGKEVI